MMKRWKIRFTKRSAIFQKLLLQSYNKIMDMKYYNIKINENGNTVFYISHIFDEFEWMTKQWTYIFRVLIRKYLFAESDLLNMFGRI